MWVNSRPGPAGIIPARDLFAFSQDARKTQQGNAPIKARHTVVLLALGKPPLVHQWVWDPVETRCIMSLKSYLGNVAGFCLH